MKIFRYIASLIMVAVMASINIAEGQQQKIVIDVDFPGGNIIVDHNENASTLYYVITTDTVFLQSDLRDTKGNWFYWYFRISGAANKMLHFQFPGPLFGSFGPAFSNDGGKTWQLLYLST
jgi:hypothetical protein